MKPTSIPVMVALISGICPLATHQAAGQSGELPGQEAPPDRPFAPALIDFCGANNVYGPEWREHGLGWCRQDFVWDRVEPENDRFEFGEFDDMVRKAHAEGGEILPILCYTARWAARDPQGVGPAARLEDWTDYVEHVVARYSAPPFDLAYFQIWNEPVWGPVENHPGGHVWTATGEEFVDLVYIPAARIIRRYGAKVVFSGWPVAYAGDIDKALMYHDAWRLTDIIGIHYHHSSAFQELYDRYIATGMCEGLWQTECGLCPFPNFYPNLYLRVLWWSLDKGFEFRDQWKLIWFAYWGAAPWARDGCLTNPDGDTPHGRRARVLSDVLGKWMLATWTGYTLSPDVRPELNEDLEGAMGFRVGDGRCVIALCISPETVAAHSVFRVGLLDLPRDPAAVALVSADGQRQDLVVSREGDAIGVDVPVHTLPCETARNYGQDIRFAIGYVVIDLAR